MRPSNDGSSPLEPDPNLVAVPCFDSVEPERKGRGSPPRAARPDRRRLATLGGSLARVGAVCRAQRSLPVPRPSPSTCRPSWRTHPRVGLNDLAELSYPPGTPKRGARCPRWCHPAEERHVPSHLGGILELTRRPLLLPWRPGQALFPFGESFRLSSGATG